MKDIGFKLVTKSKYTLPHYTITSSTSKNSHYCFGTEEGSILYSYKSALEAQQISNYPIHNVAYLSNTLIACSSDDNTFYILDIVKNKITSLNKHLHSIKFVKSQNNLFYTGSRDKNVFEWDLRTLKVTKNLEHTGSVTCLETNTNNNLLFSTNTPGTNLCSWDLRYTKLGKYYSQDRFINNIYCNNLILFKNNLYCKTVNSVIFKISQSGKLHNEIFQYNSKSFCQSIVYNDLYDCLFFSGTNELYSLKDKIIKCQNMSICLNNLRGLCCYDNNLLIAYNEKDVINYEIVPFIIK